MASEVMFINSEGHYSKATAIRLPYEASSGALVGPYNKYSSILGGASCYIAPDSTYGTYKVNGTPVYANFSFGTGDFTYETYFMNPGGVTNWSTIFLMGVNGFTSGQIFYYDKVNTALVFRYLRGATNVTFSYTIALTIGVWYYLAVERYSGHIYMSINGTVVQSWVDTTNITTTASDTIRLGNYTGANDNWSGMVLDELRISKVSRYSGQNFIPTAVEFTSDANTIGLWHFDKLLTDSSSYNQTLTAQTTTGYLSTVAKISRDYSDFNNTVNTPVVFSTDNVWAYLDLTTDETNANELLIQIYWTTLAGSITDLKDYRIVTATSSSSITAADVWNYQTSLATTTGSVGKQLVTNLDEAITSSVSTLASDISGVSTKVDTANSSLGTLATSISGVSSSVGSVSTKVDTTNSGISSIEGTLGTQTTTLSGITSTVGTISDSIVNPGELTTIPNVSSGSLAKKIQALFQYFMLQREITPVSETMYKADNSTVLASATVSENGSTIVKGKMQ